MLTRQRLLRGLLAGGVAWPSIGLGATPAAVARASVRVPLDHAAPRGPDVEVDYLTVGAFDRRRPTVFVVADGQQFYVREDVAAGFPALFGEAVNIVGLPGRGGSKSVLAALDRPGGVDWRQAYEVLRYRQWTADIDAVRRALLGDDGEIMIYGVSGGGRLAHEHLTQYAATASRCYSESAVFTPLEAESGLQHDRFWSDLPERERSVLRAALAARPDQSDLYAQLLQRQNFFVEAQALDAARGALIDAIGADDQARLRAAATAYQVDALAGMMATPAAWPIRVRQYEFVAPLLGADADDPVEPFRPDILVSAMWARPLLALRRSGAIASPEVDLRALHDARTEVTVVAGRHDHTCDYRAQIALASHYPNHRLILLDDDHLMRRLKTLPGARAALLRGWTRGFDDPGYQAAVAGLAPIRWRET